MMLILTWQIFMMKFSSGCSLRSHAASLTDFSNSESLCVKIGPIAKQCFSWDLVRFVCLFDLFLGTSRLGKRSEIKPRKTGVSSATIFGVLKSLVGD